MTPDSWLSHEFGDEYFSGKFEHLKQTIIDLDLAPKNSKIVTIGGTNGKGQTARLLASMFSHKGVSFGLWTSPHLETVCERFVYNGNNISSDDLLISLEETKKLLKNNLKSYSYFEFIFLTFLVYLKNNPVDIVILEVGLGGRLDACNAIRNDIAAVVSISREHQRLLGSTYQKILYEKLGIINVGKMLITCFELDYLKLKTKEYCRSHRCDWIDLFQAEQVVKSDNFSRRNYLMAVEIFRSLFNELPSAKIQIEDFAMRRAITFNNRVYDFYPTHNLDGFRKLFQFLNQQQYNNYDYLLISFSRREWKDLLDICRLIQDHFLSDKIKLVHFSHFKSIDEGQLLKLKSEFEFDIIQLDDITKDSNYQASKVLVTGSNYFLGHTLQYFSRQK